MSESSEYESLKENQNVNLHSFFIKITINITYDSKQHSNIKNKNKCILNVLNLQFNNNH